jgi:hypothetical protein
MDAGRSADGDSGSWAIGASPPLSKSSGEGFESFSERESGRSIYADLVFRLGNREMPPGVWKPTGLLASAGIVSRAFGARLRIRGAGLVFRETSR